MGSVVVAGGVCKIKHFLRLLDFIQKLRYTRNRAGGRMQARCWLYCAGREVAHHLGEEDEGHYLVHVLLEKHAGDLSDARCWIQRLLYTGAVWASLCRAAVVGKACNIRQERCDGPG